MKFNKKTIAAVVAALLAVLGVVQQLLSSLPESPAPVVPSAVSADAGVQ